MVEITGGDVKVEMICTEMEKAQHRAVVWLRTVGGLRSSRN